MTTEEITLNSGYKHLSDYYSELPSKCLLNKGITGCGGTTVELTSKRNSIILVPNINLILSKLNAHPNIIPLYGDISETTFRKKLSNTIGFKKIVATYDALPRLISFVDNYSDYFLLIDEYHILFNSYSFRHEPIKFILKNYKLFKDYCFMTATPLDENTILEEIKELNRINIKWENAVKMKIKIEDTYKTTETLIKEINKCLESDYNLHIFINSVLTIKNIVKKIDTKDYRTICSKESGKKYGLIKAEDITSPVRKINFYTSTAFEGVDIYDPVGKSIIISDSSLSTTLLDISTLLIQICGRLRNSIYKDSVTFIVNTFTHRYLKYENKSEFENDVNEKIKQALARERVFINSKDEDYIKAEINSYSPEVDLPLYVNMYNNKLYYDCNIMKADCKNYSILKEIYNSSISVLKEISDNEYFTNDESNINPYMEYIIPGKLYTYEELCGIFTPILDKENIIFDGKVLNNILNGRFKKVRRVKNGKQIQFYIFG